MEAYSVVKCDGSHIPQTAGSQMLALLSALSACRALPPEIFLGTHIR
jgi:hypothetical protein